MDVPSAGSAGPVIFTAGDDPFSSAVSDVRQSHPVADNVVTSSGSPNGVEFTAAGVDTAATATATVAAATPSQQHLSQTGTQRYHTLPQPGRLTFSDEEDARSFTNQWVREHGYAVTIRRRKNDRSKSHETIYLKCERGGKYGERGRNVELQERKRRNTGTRLCDCPFRVVLRQRTDHWTMDPQDLRHNHDPSDAVAQPANRRQDMKKVQHLIASHMAAGLSPAQSLAAIQQEYNYTLAITPRDMWNERNSIRKNRRATSLAADTTTTGMDEHFLLFKDENGLHQTTRVAFIHKQAVERLLPHYSKILCMDTLCKSNQSAFPVTNLIGITAENEPFIIASALMNHDTSGYAWLLKCVSKLYHQLALPSPAVVITASDKELHQAVREVLPDAHHMLCVRDAEQEIRVYAKQYFYRQTARRTSPDVAYQSDDEDFVDPSDNTALDTLIPSVATEVNRMINDFVQSIMAVIDCTTEESYHAAWSHIKKVYGFVPGLLLYIRRKWLSRKENLVAAWTDRFRNYGIRSIPNIEAYHRIIRRQVAQQAALWSDIKDLVLPYFQRRLQELIGKIETGKTVLRPEWSGELFTQCRSVISTHALTLVKKRMDLFGLIPFDQSSSNESGNYVATELSPCKGHFTSVTGIPCEHVIQQRIYLRSSLKPTDFDPHWHLSTKRITVDYGRFTNASQQQEQEQEQMQEQNQKQRQHQQQHEQGQQEQSQHSNHFLPPASQFPPQLAPEVQSQTQALVDPNLVLPSSEHTHDSVNQAFDVMTASFNSGGLGTHQSPPEEPSPAIITMKSWSQLPSPASAAPMSIAPSHSGRSASDAAPSTTSPTESTNVTVGDRIHGQIREHIDGNDNVFTVCPVM